MPLGGITALIGANDSGKTTVLRAVRNAVVDATSMGPVRGAQGTTDFIAFRAPAIALELALGDSMLEGGKQKIHEWLKLAGGDGPVDVVAQIGPRPGVWLAHEARLVSGDRRLSELAATARIDVGAYPTWMPLPLDRLCDGIPSRLARELSPVVQLPGSLGDLGQRVVYATGVLLQSLTAVRAAVMEGALDLPGLEPAADLALAHWREWQASKSADPWLVPVMNPPNGQEVVHPDLALASWIFSALLQRALPQFIGDRYRCEVVAAPLSAWIQGKERVWTMVHDRQTAFEFPAEDLAEGFRLWLQLALMDACADVATLATWITEAFSESQRAIDGNAEWSREIAPALEALQRLGMFGVFDKSLDPSALLAQLANACSPMAEPGGLGDLGASSPYIAILDEPERQLHARLQRDATRWLIDRARARSSSYLIATHSVAFMAMNDQTSYLNVIRGADGLPRVTPVNTREIEATDALAGELGLDRGELLGLVDRIVFVEGVTDRVFLEGLYGPEIRAAGVVLLPLAGATKTSSVIPMTELLLRFSVAPVTVILDDVGRTKFEALTTDAAYRKEASRDKQVELRELARLVQLAIELERDITAAAISTKDIFDLVDEDVVADHLVRTGKRAFPGHAEAREEVGNAKWKAVYLDRYGIDILDPGTFASAGMEMRRRGLHVPELRELLGLS